MERRKPSTIKVPASTNVYRDDVDDFIRTLGHDPAKVLRLRVHGRAVQVDLLVSRVDCKVTVTQPIIGREDDE